MDKFKIKFEIGVTLEGDIQDFYGEKNDTLEDVVINWVSDGPGLFVTSHDDQVEVIENASIFTEDIISISGGE